jgi:hypothetical protein
MTAVFPSLPGLDIGVKRTVLTSTGVQSGTSGTEQRASWWSSPKYEYEVTFNALRQLTGNFTVSQDEAQVLSNFFTGLGGQFATFYFTDPLNSVASTLSFGAGDGSTVAFSLTDQPASRTNYCVFSQGMTNGTYWVLDGGTVAGGVLDPIGGQNAVTLTATTNNGQLVGGPTVPIGIYTSTLWLRRRSGSGSVAILKPDYSASVPVAITSQWQAFSATSPSVTLTSAYIGVIIGTSGDQVDIAFAQAEPGTTPTDYIPTTTAPVTVTANGVAVVPNGSPSIYRNDWQGIQQLYPTPRTNYLIGSYNSLPQNNGPLINLTATSGVSDPAGTNQAWTLTATAAGAVVVAYGYMTKGSPATTSMWLRRRTGSGQIYILNVSAATPVPVTLTTSWQRFSSSGLSSSTYNAAYWGVELATSGDQVDVAFGQVEPGSVPTSYIPTTATAVTVTDYALSGNTVTLAVAPLTGAALTWSGSFYYKVRFVQDNLDYEQIVIGAWKGDSLKIRTVKG